MEVWNNPSCSKCAAARSTMDEARVPYRLRAYLDEPPTAAELVDVLHRLDAQPWEICGAKTAKLKYHQGRFQHQLNSSQVGVSTTG